ncbi:hypothetical protein [Pseudorhodobacter ferrugineus]|uniref:hypothetical protein n=1 Tax=Pseudorhodobacter ferrugineus TaxID=77008 RepID=UPI0003B4AAC9
MSIQPVLDVARSNPEARKASWLVVDSDGPINAAASDVRHGEMTEPDQQRTAPAVIAGSPGQQTARRT